MLATTKRHVSFLATWYRFSQVTHYLKQACKLSISPLFITIMTRTFQRFYGKQRMLSKNVMLFRSPTIQQRHKATQEGIILPELVSPLLLTLILHYRYSTVVKVKLLLAIQRQECKSPLRLRSIYLDPCRRS